MAIYDPKSLKAEEFISDNEIRETLAYAEANKNNIELIESILEKARPQKTRRDTYVQVLRTERHPCFSHAIFPR